MVQEQAKLMLSTLTNDKRAFKKFYKKGHFSYSNNKDYYGEVAILDNAIISFLQSSNDESKVVATVSFKDGGTFIYKLFGKNYSFIQYGKDPSIWVNPVRMHVRRKDDIIIDISTIRKHCNSAKEKALAIEKASSVLTRFKSISVQSDTEISYDNALLLLQESLKKLNMSRQLNEVDVISDLNK